LHSNSGACELFPYLQRYLPGVIKGSALKRKLLQGVQFLDVTDRHGPVSSVQHDVQSVAAAETLKDPREQAKHAVDPLPAAKVPCGHPIHARAPAPIQHGQMINNRKMNKKSINCTIIHVYLSQSQCVLILIESFIYTI
jgi:hypothetical protein